jgi:hypothetical protein
MWPSIKRLRDWAVPELGPATPRDAIHVRSELAGLVLEDQPIPWNAEAVVVEFNLRVPPTVRRKEDFTLRFFGRSPIVAESMRPEAPGDRSIVLFRMPVPNLTTKAELHWRDRFLGRVELPVLDKVTFLDSLKLELPTLHARLGEESVACQTFISSQCSGLTADGLLTAPTSLAPVLEMGITVDIRGAAGELLSEMAVPLSGGQLLGKQALISAHPRKLPKRSGQWSITWKVARHELAMVRARAVAASVFRRSLRIVGTRFVVDCGHGISLRTLVPADNTARAGPCFLVASGEPGMAARATFEIIPVGTTAGEFQPLVQEVLVTDGPTPIAPGTMPASELAGVQAFDLRHHGRSLGTLSMHPVPAAHFNGEGGFTPPPDFSWTHAAEEELSERLGKLMGG